jgi:hypothetical protein
MTKTYKELVRALKQPIEQKYIDHKTQGGAKIAFVNITTVKDLLDERLGEHVWESSVKSCQQIGENLVMIVTVMIHASDGAYSQDGTGVESINLRGYGDVASNAYAQAFRRACESHGLARELWRMELSEEQKDISREQQEVSRHIQIANKIATIKHQIKNLGGKVESESFEGMSEAELIELGKEYKSQLERLQLSKGASAK